MRIKSIQAKNVDKLPILKFLSNFGGWACIFKEGAGEDRKGVFENSVWNAIPMTVPYKVGRAAMANLVKRGLVNGCTCGCRGDFTITEKGLQFIEENNHE